MSVVSFTDSPLVPPVTRETAEEWRDAADRVLRFVRGFRHERPERGG